MSAQTITALERSLGLVFWDEDTLMGVQPEWKRIPVGKSCIVLEYRNTIIAGASGDDGANQGSITWTEGRDKHPTLVTIKVADDYEQRDNMRGRRDDSIKSVNKDGTPIPEVALLMAILSDDFSDRLDALNGFMHGTTETKGMLLAYIEKTAPEESRPNAVATPCLIGLSQDPIFFRGFAGDWMLEMFKRDKVKELADWQTAAFRAMKRRREINQTNKKDHYSRILSTIKEAALECKGVPYQSLIREKLDDKNVGKIPDDTVKSILETLGFAWIPGKPDWNRHWKPQMEEKRGG